MRAPPTRVTGRVDYRKKIQDLFDFAGKYAVLCDSPKRVEFKLCAYLAAWESSARHDGKASQWFVLWQQRCRKRHHGKVGLTLADPVKATSLSERWQVSREEEAKAYKRVREGLRQVLKVTLNQYCPTEQDEPCFGTGTDEPAILFQKTRDSFKSAKSFASPEGYEVFLLTLIELFEQSLGGNEKHSFAHESWISEIHRRRLGGSPQSRTLADVAPADVRLERQEAFPEKERTKILRSMLSSMRHITEELATDLEMGSSRNGARPW